LMRCPDLRSGEEERTSQTGCTKDGSIIKMLPG